MVSTKFLVRKHSKNTIFLKKKKILTQTRKQNDQINLTLHQSTICVPI